MSIEEDNKATVSRIVDMLNSTDHSHLEDLCSPQTARDLRNRWATMPFSEHHMEITEIVAEGDKVMAFVATRGVHTPEWEGIPATGKRWATRGAFLNRLEGGKVVDGTTVWDELGHLKQLGATITAPSERA